VVTGHGINQGIDLVSFASLRPRLREEIEKEMVVVYEAAERQIPLVWDTAQVDLPKLKLRLQEILERGEG
jgi:uncharacterized protein with HEPN domain